MIFPSMDDWQQMAADDAEQTAVVVPLQPPIETADRCEELQDLISI